MTSLNPSHNIFRTPQGRHAQAVHDPQTQSQAQDEIESEDESTLLSEKEKAERRAKREARRRVRANAPPMPDLRFEQSYLLSLRPYLTPSPTPTNVTEKSNTGGNTDKAQQTKSLVLSAEDDAVYKWGREVQVDWKMVAYVTFRDQILSPLFQGALWGFGTLFLASTASTLRSALYPASHIPKGRMTGGPGGKIDQAGAGEAVGGATGWWRRFVKSWGGAVETATI